MCRHLLNMQRSVCASLRNDSARLDRHTVTYVIVCSVRQSGSNRTKNAAWQTRRYFRNFVLVVFDKFSKTKDKEEEEETKATNVDLEMVSLIEETLTDSTSTTMLQCDQ